MGHRNQGISLNIRRNICFSIATGRDRDFWMMRLFYEARLAGSEANAFSIHDIAARREFNLIGVVPFLLHV